MPRLVWLLALGIGCGEEEVAQETVAPQKKAPVEEAVVEEVIQTPAQKLSRLRSGLLAAEDPAAIVESAKALAEEHPDLVTSDILWDVLAQAAWLSDGGAGLLGYLTPETSLGAQVEQVAALGQYFESKKPTDLADLKARAASAEGDELLALNARLAIQTSPDDAFARPNRRTEVQDLLIQLYRAGADEPSREANWRALEPYLDAVSAVSGVEAALYRAECWQRLQQPRRAYQEWLTVLKSGSELQQKEAQLTLAKLVVGSDLGWNTPAERAADMAKAMRWSSELVENGLRQSDPKMMQSGLAIMRETAVASNLTGEAVMRLMQVGLVVDGTSGDAELHAQVKAALAEVAYRSGRVRIAMHAGLSVLDLDTPSRADAAWWGGLAAFEMEAGDKVLAAAEHLSDARKTVLTSLGHAAEGRLVQANESFDSDGLSASDAAIVLNRMASFGDAEAIKRGEASVRFADESGDMTLRIRNRLDQETLLRLDHQYAAAKSVRAELLALASTDAMKIEVGARSLLTDGSGAELSQIATDGSEATKELVGLWKALAENNADVSVIEQLAVNGEAFTRPLIAWGLGRTELLDSSAKVYGSYLATLESIPTHRQGRLSAGTALDGSTGLPTLLERQKMSGDPTNEAYAQIGVVMHEIDHRRNLVRDGLAVGRVLTHSLHSGPRGDLLAAAARSRFAVTQWLIGDQNADGSDKDLFPHAAFDELVAAENHIASHVDVSDETGTVTGYGRTFHQLMPRPGVPYEVLKRSLDKQSVGLVSYQQYGEQLHVVALSSYGQVSLALSGKASKAQANIAAHMSDLLGGKLDNVERTLAEKMQNSSASLEIQNQAGEAIRKQLLEPVLSTALSSEDGTAGTIRSKIMVVGPDWVRSLPWGTLPENRVGEVRFYESYSFYTHPVIGTLAQTDCVTQGCWSPAFLGLAAPPVYDQKNVVIGGGSAVDEFNRQNRKEKPQDLDNVERVFGEQQQSIVGEALTRDEWMTWIAGARYIYLSDFESGKNGEFVLRDGEITLDDIRNTPLRAELVTLGSASDDLAYQAARAQAFIDAGARVVMFAAWEIPPNELQKSVPRFLDKATSKDVTGSDMTSALREILGSLSAGDGSDQITIKSRGGYMVMSSI